MAHFFPLRNIQRNMLFKKDDLLVIFGEVFDRGYVNGLVEEAEKFGLQVIYTTVGRRNKEGHLLPLTPDEIIAKNQKNLINIPLEAGFDLEPDDTGLTPVDQLKEYGLHGWEEAKLNWQSIDQSHRRGIERFRLQTQRLITEIKNQYWSPGKNIFFAHTMAGGFPRAKVVMPIANRIFKGSGPRFESSERFWNSDIGKLCALSFQEVTAETFKHLIELTSELRFDLQKSGNDVAYLAYGYHGNEPMIGDHYKWFSYTPYLQGWAKLRLEKIIQEAFKNNIKTCVFNVPEILTNSSSIFLGIEIALYSLLRAFRKEAPGHAVVNALTAACKAKLKPNVTMDTVDDITQTYLLNPIVQNLPQFATWPQHNTPEGMAAMSATSQQILDLHINTKNLLTTELSEIIFKTTGNIMFHEMSAPRTSVAWIGHDLVVKTHLDIS